MLSHRKHRRAITPGGTIASLQFGIDLEDIPDRRCIKKLNSLRAAATGQNQITHLIAHCSQ